MLNNKQQNYDTIASEDYNFQFRNAKLCELIALCSFIPKIKLLLWWMGKILEKDKLKNRATFFTV